MHFKESSKWKKNHLHSSKSFFWNCFLNTPLLVFSSQTKFMFCCCRHFHLDIIQVMGNLVQCVLKGGKCEWDAFPWLLLLFGLNNYLLRESSLTTEFIVVNKSFPCTSNCQFSLYHWFLSHLFHYKLIIYWPVSSFHLQNLLHECRDFVFHQSHLGL